MSEALGRCIYLFGDSITDFGCPATNAPRFLEGKDRGPGFGDLLREMFSRRADVLNRGYVGYNTKWFLEQKCEQSFVTETLGPPLLCVVMLGANDSADPLLNKMNQSVLPHDFYANLKTITQSLQARCARVIVCSPPPIAREKYLRWRKSMPGMEKAADEEVEDRTSARTSMYAVEAERVAGELNVGYANVFEGFGGVSAMDSSLVSDGLHLSSKGDELVFQILMRCINQKFPELLIQPDANGGVTGSASVSGLPSIGPWWNLIDSSRLELAFPSLTTSSALVSASVSSFRPRPQILLLGDSLTQLALKSPLWGSKKGGPGWGDWLQGQFCRRYDVIVRGLSGYNSTWALAGWEHIGIPQLRNLDLATVFFGANDASDDIKQHVSLEQFESNIRSMLQRLLEQKTKRILVLGCPPIDRTKYIAWVRGRNPALANKTDDECVDRSSERAAHYSKVAEKIVLDFDQPNIQFLNLGTVFGSPPDPQQFKDGLHFSAKGNKTCFEAIYRIISNVWPELRVSTCNFFCSQESQSESLIDRPCFQELAQAHSKVSKKQKSEK